MSTNTRAHDFWLAWSTFKDSGHMSDVRPDGLDEQQRERLSKNYTGTPGKIFSKTKLATISLLNAWEFLEHLQLNSVTSAGLQEHCSGISALTSRAYRSDFAALFPTDTRRGWSPGLKAHQDIAGVVCEALRVQLKAFAPERAPRSRAGAAAHPDEEAANRI